MKIVLLFAVVTVVKCRGTIDVGTSDDPGPGPEHRDRLPRDTEPISYKVRLAPEYDDDTGKFKFWGQVEILVRVNHITADVTLNARDMVIKEVAIIEYQSKTDVVLIGYEMIKADEFLVIHAGANLLAGRQYLIKVTFLGYLRPDMTGFYRSTYTVNGVNKYVTTTLMCFSTSAGRQSLFTFFINRTHKCFIK